MATMMHEPLFYVFMMTAFILGVIIPLVAIRWRAGKELHDSGGRQDPQLR
jgi:hypothetical protein